MTDAECVELLRWALPRLRLRWSGFRRVRRQVCRRIGRRLRELGLADAAAYRAHLETHPDEWLELDALCRISISRFFRDRFVFDALATNVLPALAARARADGRPTLRAWSAGCASGEEAYSLAILWESVPRREAIHLQIVATDAAPHLIERARRGCYTKSSVRELPPDGLAAAFERRNADWCIRPSFREAIEFRCQDLREQQPPGPFDLVLCRNVIFTYFDAELQREVLGRIVDRLRPGGALAIGLHEVLPADATGLAPWPGARAVYRRCDLTRTDPSRPAGAPPGRAGRT